MGFESAKILEPLHWPNEFVKSSKLHKWFSAHGFSALLSQTKSSLQNQLSERNALTRELWCTEGGLLALCDVVFPRIAEWMKWPNSYFIPNDLCDIIFWDPIPDCSFESLVLELSELLVVNPLVFDASRLKGKLLKDLMHDLL